MDTTILKVYNVQKFLINKLRLELS